MPLLLRSHRLLLGCCILLETPSQLQERVCNFNLMQRDLIYVLDGSNEVSCHFTIVLPTSHDAIDANIFAPLHKNWRLALIVKLRDHDFTGRVTDLVDLLTNLLLTALHACNKHEHADWAPMDHHRGILSLLLQSIFLLQYHFDRHRHQGLIFTSHLS